MNNNNNPLNIKWADPENHNVQWVGSAGYDNRGHAVFEDPAMGIRAAMRSIQKKLKNGKNTLLLLLKDWAPESDTIGSIEGAEQNDPEEYARYVSARTFYGIREKLPDPARDPLAWGRIVRAMSHWELGSDCPYNVLLRGIGYWLADFVEKDNAAG